MGQLAFGSQGCGVGGFPGELLLEVGGLACGEAGEFLLDLADAVLCRDGFQGGLGGGEFGFLGGGVVAVVVAVATYEVVFFDSMVTWSFFL